MKKKIGLNQYFWLHGFFYHLVIFIYLFGNFFFRSYGFGLLGELDISNILFSLVEVKIY